MIEKARRKLIFALDVETLGEAERWVARLRNRVGLFKVGKQLFTRCGPDAVRMIRDNGGEVFLDLKYHDIPNTVSKAAVEAARLGVKMFNLHALGGREMMTATAAALRDHCGDGPARPLLLAVTILTSMSSEALREVGIPQSPEEIVPRLALLAKQSGIDGVVASPREIALIRAGCGPGFTIVTPGVRPLNAAADDQKRIAAPGEAIRAGADFLVVGRPIAAAADPEAAASAMVEEMAAALGDG
ncbi:MAG: orotidine-5'-phosphate decarboxylase [Desulfuromonadaceae bacterium]|nr:orotidine-5'-phosphate decarboxylase [Desulfuromonadaceae bacterium]